MAHFRKSSGPDELIQIKHYSTRGPMCTGVETVKQSLNSIETNQGLFHSLNAHRHNANK